MKLCISLCCPRLPFVFSLEREEKRNFSDLRKDEGQKIWGKPEIILGGRAVVK